MWSRGVNSDAALRAGKVVQGQGGALGGATGGIRGGGIGGRGSSTERGRGRGRGSHYNRGLSFDESDGNSGPPSSYSRSIRTFDRDRMQVSFFLTYTGSFLVFFLINARAS